MTTATATRKTKKKVVDGEKDIRAGLPVATKGGTAHKPVWSIGGKEFKFVLPTRKDGRTKDGQKVRLGNRIYAKYVAGKTTAGDDLMFVGVFAAADAS